MNLNLGQYVFLQYRMSRRAMVFGIVSIVLGFMYMPFFSVPIAFFAFLFASLSRGNAERFSREARIGITTAVIGILLAISLTYKVYTALATDEDYRNSVIELSEVLYGDSYESINGESFSDMLNRFLPSGNGGN